jgi:hypothetical protein
LSAEPAHSAHAYGYHSGPYGNYGQANYHQQWPPQHFNYGNQSGYENSYGNNYSNSNYANNWPVSHQWTANWPNWGQHQQQQQHSAQQVLQNNPGPANPQLPINTQGLVNSQGIANPQGLPNPDVSYQRTLEYVQQCQNWSTNPQQR